MKNIAKCKLCQSVIESFTVNDTVSCKCGEITISGGNETFYSTANDYANFLRVDDEGNEIVVIVKESHNSEPKSKSSIQDLLKMLDEMIASIDKLPSQAMYTPVNHYDFVSSLILVSSIFKALSEES